MISLTTDDIRAEERVEFWADLVSRHVTPMQIEPDRAHPLHGRIEARAIGDFGVARVAGAGVRALHTRSHVARAVAHVHAACVHVSGEATLVRGGQRIVLKPGDVFITDSRDAFTFDLRRPWQQLVVTMPTCWLDGRVARPEALAGAVLRDQPLGRLWASHLATGFALADQLSPAAGALLARQSADLLGQLLDESHADRSTPSDAARAAILASARHVIALRFAEPELAPADIARHVGVSARTLARAFASDGEKIMRRVFDERVRKAARLLTAPEAAQRTISQIAFACGFNDLSHFGRVFAARMQMTPSAWRRAGH